MLLSQLGVVIVDIEGAAEVAHVAHARLAPHDVAHGVDVVGPARRHDHRVLAVEELLEAADVAHDLGHADAALLKVAEAKALPIAGVEPHVGGVVQDVDVLVRERLRVVDQDEVVLGLLRVEPVLAALGHKDVDQVPGAREGGADDEADGLPGVHAQELDKGHDAEVPALARLVAVEVDDDKVAVGDVEPRARDVARDGVVVVGVEAVLHDVRGLGVPLGLDDAVPEVGEHDGAIRVLMHKVDEGVLLVLVHQVHVGDELEPAVGDGVQLVEKGGQHDEVVVHDDHVGVALLDEALDQVLAKALLLGVLVLEGVVELDVVGQGPLRLVLLVLMVVLEAEHADLEQVLVGRELLEQLVEHLGVPVELGGVSPANNNLHHFSQSNI